jgi:DNA polymerase III alpha subunit (gram-positive type)
MAIHYYTVDTETTGLSKDLNEIFQISIIRCSDRHQLSRKIKVENLETVNQRALEVTNTKMSDLLLGDKKEDVVQECENFFAQDGVTPEHRCIVGHNIVGFDLRFLFKLWEKCGKEFPAALWLDTLKYVRKYAKANGLDNKQWDLNNACIKLGITPKKGAHSALIDTQNNYLLWKEIQKRGVPQVELIERRKHILEEE